MPLAAMRWAQSRPNGELGSGPVAEIADAAAAGLIELGLRMSDALAAGLIELGLPTSDGAALGLIASGWAREPSHRPRIMTAGTHIEAQLRLLMPRSHLPRTS